MTIMTKDLDKYFDEFYEVYKTLSLEELQKIAFNAKDEETRLFFGAIVNYSIKVNFNKALENEKY
ncbi:hypothetical protein [Fusobacterium sp. FSA-380-WT-2B]|uniref:hypothetical protein n=1 Tax=Fusobacterium sp. FSA-380-WT-2B TaxID=2605786 RepID=UPI0012B18EC3|nr:hypothetical protein [Fusobacterium sp. FSA-380-WT-2B]MSS61453.1 hypothetical protein [Fusobacterium sp. FSA-380-WT-2B]